MRATPSAIAGLETEKGVAAGGAYLSGWSERPLGWRNFVAPPHRVARWTGDG